MDGKGRGSEAMKEVGCGHKHCGLCYPDNGEIKACSGLNYHALKELARVRKELAAARRLNRRMVYKYLLKGWSLSHLTEGHASLEAFVPKARKVMERFGRLREVQKKRLLQEMRPTDLRALGLTPPPKEREVVNPCEKCGRDISIHTFGRAIVHGHTYPKKICP